MDVQSTAEKLATVLYENEATVLYHYTADTITVSALHKWIEGTIDMIREKECDEFTLQQMNEMTLHADEIIAVVRSWGA